MGKSGSDSVTWREQAGRDENAVFAEYKFRVSPS
jgi:hypothetical protein